MPSVDSLKSKTQVVLHPVDDNKMAEKHFVINDTTKTLTKEQADSIARSHFKPNPAKSVWRAAIIPGYGQILNRKYWKLPIVYGGFLGCAFAITWNSQHYNLYKKAYIDITDSDPNTNSYYDVMRPGTTIDQYGGISGLTSSLNSMQKSFHRYRDLSIIVTIGFYALTILDAYVDAQLYDFDITPDLSFNMKPTLLENRNGYPTTLGLQCSFNIK